MSHDPLDGVYSFVERAYVRMQAGDLLIRCLEDISIAPIQQLVESFILGGPTNLNALSETLSEATRRKLQVQDDLRQLFRGLESSLGSYGFVPGDQCSKLVESEQSARAWQTLLCEQNILDQSTQTACLQILQETRDIFENLSSRLKLLEEIEAYLQDWLWGIASLAQRRESKLH